MLSCSVISDSLQAQGLKPARLFCPWNFPDKNTGVGCHSLLQGIFPSQGLNLGLSLPLEKAMAPHSSTLAWKIPQTEEPGGLQSMGLLRVGHD